MHFCYLVFVCSTFSILQNLFKLLTLTTQSSILIEILDDDTDLYQEWDAALEKYISGEVLALWKSPIYASFILNGLCNVDVIVHRVGR